jgi:carbamoyltransferase
MKFLGVRNGHDANVTYTNNEKVRYLKLERNMQIKHYWWEEDAQIDDVETVLSYAQKVLGFDFDELDGIAISPSSDRHPCSLPEPYELYKRLDKSDELADEFWWQFDCPCFVIDHHWAHALSCWPLHPVDPFVSHVVVDGIGDHSRHLSIFKGNKLVEFSDSNDTLGLSVMLEHWAEKLKIKGMRIDLSGKIMAMAAMHTVPPDALAKFLERAGPLAYRHIDRCAKIVNQPDLIDFFRNNDEGYINSAYVLHEFAKVKLPALIHQFIPIRRNAFTYSGGTAQNTVVNNAIRAVFPEVVIPPHCPDDGISLGCVEFLRQHFKEIPFDNYGFPHWQSDEAPPKGPNLKTIKAAAEALAKGKIVGWYQGHGEIGPRALGNRSILMNPTIKDGQKILNERVKKREGYRPYGASILLDDVRQHFDFSGESPYMLFVVDAVDRDAFPAVTHLDGTCRIQTVRRNEPAFTWYYHLLEEFKKLTGIPMLLNTSLNVNGKPIAGHINDAVELFKTSDMDMLVVGRDVANK